MGHAFQGVALSGGTTTFNAELAEIAEKVFALRVLRFLR